MSDLGLTPLSRLAFRMVTLMEPGELGQVMSKAVKDGADEATKKRVGEALRAFGLFDEKKAIGPEDEMRAVFMTAVFVKMLR